jgi:hypothetical protein
MRDTFANFPAEAIKKMVLLTDAISGVPHCEAFYDDFLKEFTAKGLQTAKTTDFMV